MSPRNNVDYFIAGPASLLGNVGLDSRVLRSSRVNVDGKAYLVGRGHEEDVGDIVATITETSAGAVCRLMDRVFLVHGPEGIGAAGIAFFEVAAEEYEALISLERNAACATHLLDSVLEVVGRDQTVRVLDFGCGTGISSLAMQKTGVDVVAYDCCAAMRERARRSVLKVVDALSDCESRSIDVVVACYVMHFGIRRSDAVDLSRVVAVGGVIAANFHKGLGASATTTLLQGSGFAVIDPASDASDKFGLIVLFKRSG